MKAMKVELTTHEASDLRSMLGQALDTFPREGGSISGSISSGSMSLAWAFTEEGRGEPLSAAAGDWRERWKKSMTKKCITLEISKNGGKG